MNIHESAEDYLEAILKIREKKGMVRSIDIVNELGYSKPSISIAMKRLRENGYIIMDEDNFITLTDSGMDIAQKIYTRHKTLTKFLVNLGVDEDTAEKDACKIEHDISDITFERISEMVKNYS
ncbi:MAG: metal-dependent transcriptional regulator [Lachnospiraceae bacterium]|nr:metal-dependent transcriptional regulator [Lachnospiraceae bacterium]